MYKRFFDETTNDGQGSATKRSANALAKQAERACADNFNQQRAALLKTSAEENNPSPAPRA